MAYINKTEKDVFRLITSVGQRKNFESSWGTLPQTFGFRALMHYHWATETLRWARSITKFVALFLYRAQNLLSLLFYLQTWRYRHCWRSEVRFLMETQNFFFVPRSWNIFLYFFTELQTCYLSYSINKTVGPLVIFSVFSTWFACWKNLHCNQCLLKGLCWPRNVLQWYFIIVIVHLFHSAGTHKEFKTDAKNKETFAAHGLK